MRDEATDATSPSQEVEVHARVEAKTQEADGVVSLLLRDVDGRPLPAWMPGAHVDLIVDGVPTRQYSLCGDSNDRRTWRLGVLREPDSRGGSLHVHDRIEVGDRVRVSAPRNHFELVPSARYLFIAGGIGITPILPMIAAAEASGSDWRLAYGGRRRESMAFLDELAQHGDRVSVCPQDETGLLDLDGLVDSLSPGTLIYCCGPEALLSAVEDRCAQLPSQTLHLERFAPKPADEPARATSFDVVLERSGLVLTVPTDRSILEVAEEAGVKVLSSCSEGTCGTCETAVLEGEPDHRDSVLDEGEKQANDCMMICVSRSCTERLILDL